MKRRPNVLKRRLEGIMGKHLNRSLRDHKTDVILYGSLFIQSEAGSNWENLWKGSDRSPIEPNWLQFYYDLRTDKFQDLIETLLCYKIGDYQKEKLIQDIKELVEKIKGIKPATHTSPNLRSQVSIEPSVLKKNEETIKFLFENDVVTNYPWAEKEPQDIILFGVINDKFKETLLDGYYSIINHYENEDQQKIQMLEKQVAQLNNKITTLKAARKALKLENEELIRTDRQKSDVKSKTEEKDTPDSIAFILAFLYRMGLLDNYIWPEEKTDLQIAALLTDLLTLRGRDEINIEAFSRDRKRIINQEERGQNILAKHDADAKQAITKRFPKFNFEQQEFLLKFKSKAK